MMKDNRIALIIDALQSDAAAVFSLQLAKVIANCGATTLLMDTALVKDSMLQAMNIPQQKYRNILSLSDVLAGTITLNQAKFKYEKSDVILGNPFEKSITNISESYFSVLRDDFLLMAANYNKALVNIGVLPDIKNGLIFAEGAEQALITTTSNPFAIAKAYELMALLPKDIKLWLAVFGAQNENESSHVFITLMRALKEMLKRDLSFAGAIDPAKDGDAKKIALKMGLI